MRTVFIALIAILFSSISFNMQCNGEKPSFLSGPECFFILSDAVHRNDLQAIELIMDADIRGLISLPNQCRDGAETLACKLGHVHAFQMLVWWDTAKAGINKTLPSFEEGILSWFERSTRAFPSYSVSQLPLQEQGNAPVYQMAMEEQNSKKEANQQLSRKRKANNKEKSARKHQRTKPDEVPAQNNFILTRDANIEDAMEYLTRIRQSVDPGNILLILDLDGTITNCREPDNESNFRGMAEEMIRDNIGAGVEVLVASAFNSPAQTIRTIEKLKLNAILECDREELHQGNFVYKDCEYEFYKKGRVGSIKTKGEKYFRNKALSVLLGALRNPIQSYKYLVFVDDSGTNIGFFKDDIKKLDLAAGTIVRAYHLGDPAFEPEL